MDYFIHCQILLILFLVFLSLALNLLAAPSQLARWSRVFCLYWKHLKQCGTVWALTVQALTVHPKLFVSKVSLLGDGGIQVVPGFHLGIRKS